MTVLLYIISTLDSSIIEIINDNVTRRCEPLPAGFPLGAAAGNEECANVLEDLEPFKHQL